MVEWDRDTPLARAKGETGKANRALVDYAQMGVNRSLRELARGYGAGRAEDPPTRAVATVFNWSRRYQWQLRVARYDDMTRAQEMAQYEAERLEWRKKRRQMAQALFGKTAAAMAQLVPEDASLAQVTMAVKTTLAELRAEYDDLPVARHELTGRDGGAVVVQRAEIDYDHMTDAQLKAIIIAAQAFRGAQNTERNTDDTEND